MAGSMPGRDGKEGTGKVEQGCGCFGRPMVAGRICRMNVMHPRRDDEESQRRVIEIEFVLLNSCSPLDRVVCRYKTVPKCFARLGLGDVAPVEGVENISLKVHVFAVRPSPFAQVESIDHGKDGNEDNQGADGDCRNDIARYFPRRGINGEGDWSVKDLGHATCAQNGADRFSIRVGNG